MPKLFQQTTLHQLTFRIQPLSINYGTRSCLTKNSLKTVISVKAINASTRSNFDNGPVNWMWPSKAIMNESAVGPNMRNNAP